MTVFVKGKDNAKDFANAMVLVNAGGVELVKGQVLVTRETASAKGKLDTMRKAGKYVSAIAQAMSMVPAKVLANVMVTVNVMELVNAKENVFVLG